MKTLVFVSALVTALLLMSVIPNGRAQTSGGTSNYTFRFNTGVSSVFLNEMTFASQQPLNLGACTVTEQINGPLSCALNCDQQAVCLLDVSGPSGSDVNDVMELVTETPVPNPAPSASVSGFGMMLREADSSVSDESRRIEAYNSAS